MRSDKSKKERPISSDGEYLFTEEVRLPAFPSEALEILPYSLSLNVRSNIENNFNSREQLKYIEKISEDALRKTNIMKSLSRESLTLMNKRQRSIRTSNYKKSVN